MSAFLATSLDTEVPLALLIEGEGVGGITGKLPVVRVRNAKTLNSYLDFDDNTFKTAGWVAQDAVLSEVGGGHYTRTLDLGAISGLALGDALIAEYRVNDGGSVVGAAQDMILVGSAAIDELAEDMALVRKSITNRMEEYPGTPGTLILFDDDGTSPLLSWQLRDAAGNGIVALSNTPSKRSASS